MSGAYLHICSPWVAIESTMCMLGSKTNVMRTLELGHFSCLAYLIDRIACRQNFNRKKTSFASPRQSTRYIGIRVSCY